MQQLPEASSLFSGAWEIYKKKMNLLLGIAVLPAIATTAAGLLQHSASAQGALPMISAAKIVGAILLTMFGLWGALALVYGIDRGAKEPWDAFRKTSEDLGSYIWATFLALLLIVIGILLLVVPGIILGL